MRAEAIFSMERKMDGTERAKLYIGIDMDEDRALISFLREGEKSPVSVGKQIPEETYRYPTSLFIGRGGNYLYGSEAEKKRRSAGGDFYDHLYLRARELAGTDGFEEAAGRLAVFIRRLIRLKESVYQKEEFEQHVVFAVPQIDERAVSVFRALKRELSEEASSLSFMDYAESFFYYAWHQEDDIHSNAVALFDYSADRVHCTILAKKLRTAPQTIVSGSRDWPLPKEPGYDRDSFFLEILKEAFEKRVVSGVFLLGDGFDGDWLTRHSDSLRFLVSNRRVFIGKNLYTKGAAYAAFERNRSGKWPYSYDCPYKLGADAAVRVMDGGKEQTVMLAQAGENWYESEQNFDAVLMGNAEIELLVRKREDREDRVIPMKLSDVWDREERTRRICLHAFCPDVHTLQVDVRDTGFGAFYAPTGAEWKKKIPL